MVQGTPRHGGGAGSPPDHHIQQADGGGWCSSNLENGQRVPNLQEGDEGGPCQLQAGVTYLRSGEGDGELDQGQDS